MAPANHNKALFTGSNITQDQYRDIVDRRKSAARDGQGWMYKNAQEVRRASQAIKDRNLEILTDTFGYPPG